MVKVMLTYKVGRTAFRGGLGQFGWHNGSQSGSHTAGSVGNHQSIGFKYVMDIKPFKYI